MWICFCSVSSLSQCSSAFTHSNAFATGLFSESFLLNNKISKRNHRFSEWNATANGSNSKWYFNNLKRDKYSIEYLGLRMPSLGARMPTTPIGHPGPPGGPMPNACRPQGMSPSINPPGPRMYMTNSPGVIQISSFFDSNLRLFSF